MKKQKKQSLLTAIIIILVLALIVMVGTIIYEEKINMSKNQTQNTVIPTVKEEKIDDEEQLPIEDDNTDSEEIVEDEIKEPGEEQQEEATEGTEDSEQYVGEEENDKKEDSTQSKEEQAINAVKKQWGEDDSVTFSVERKKDTKYYVAVKSSNSETTWYEVDIETWEVEEY